MKDILSNFRDGPGKLRFENSYQDIEQPLNKIVSVWMFSWGIELRFHDSFEDYLVYQVTQEFLLNNPELYNHTLRSFKDFIQGKDILVFQAHPFRAGLKPADPKLLDGVEVLNGHPRHNSHNDLAYSFCEKRTAYDCGF